MTEPQQTSSSSPALPPLPSSFVSFDPSEEVDKQEASDARDQSVGAVYDELTSHYNPHSGIGGFRGNWRGPRGRGNNRGRARGGYGRGGGYEQRGGGYGQRGRAIHYQQDMSKVLGSCPKFTTIPNRMFVIIVQFCVET